MEKVILIDGKEVTFKKTAATMLFYKRQTGRDFYADLTGYLACCKKDEKGEFLKDESGSLIVEIDKALFEFDYMYDILHTMARQADPTISPDCLLWYDQFNTFPVIQVFIELIPMLLQEMSVNEKNALAAAVQSSQNL